MHKREQKKKKIKHEERLHEYIQLNSTSLLVLSKKLLNFLMKYKQKWNKLIFQSTYSQCNVN